MSKYERGRPSPKRVLFVETNRDGTVGGSHFYLLEGLRYFDRSRFEPIVLFYQANSLVDEFRQVAKVIILEQEKGFVVSERMPVLHRWTSRVFLLAAATRIVQRGYNAARYGLPWFLRIVRVVVRERIDMVCLNNAPFYTDWLLACKSLGRPCVSYFRGTRVEEGIAGRLVGIYDAVLSESNAVTEHARRHGITVRRFEVIHDGIDVEAVRRRITKTREQVRLEFLKDLRQPLIGIVNNLREWKGQHIAIEAMATVRAHHPHIVCLLVGDVGNNPVDQRYFEHLTQLVRDRDLSETICFAGRRKDVPDVLQALDVVLHTSVANEGFPRVILECMALGRPLIASCVGPTPEMIEDRVSGFLVPPGDPGALAARILSVLADASARRDVGARARARVERLFGIEANVRRTEKLFLKVLRNARSGDRVVGIAGRTGRR